MAIKFGGKANPKAKMSPGKSGGKKISIKGLQGKTKGKGKGDIYKAKF